MHPMQRLESIQKPYWVDSVACDDGAAGGASVSREQDGRKTAPEATANKPMAIRRDMEGRGAMGFPFSAFGYK